MIDDIESILIPAEEIQRRIAELGRTISEDFSGRDPLFVGILKGCFMFMADLMRCVTIPCSMDFMAVSSYGNKSVTTGAVKINKDLSEDIEGRHVILVEDILDSGLTLSYLSRYLRNRSPASVSIVTFWINPPGAARKWKRPTAGLWYPMPLSWAMGWIMRSATETSRSSAF
jgi:hypoxanthine phosphoribosyltransferase